MKTQFYFRPFNPFMKPILIALFSWAFLLFASPGHSQVSTTTPTTRPAPATQPAPASSAANWKLSKEKAYALYKVQIFVKEDPNGPKSTRAVILDSKGAQIAEIKDFDVEPDPHETVEGWSGGSLDLDADGSEDLFLRTFSGGAHCCYGLKPYSLGKGFKKIADLKLLDCGDKVKLKDLNGDGPLEIIACNAAFTYLKGIPFSLSPFP